MISTLSAKLDKIKTLEEFTTFVNNECMRRQSMDKEMISNENAYEAYAIVKNMKIEDAGDVLLYCASMNLLNAYVKQEESPLGYSFKENIHYMTSILINLNIDDVYIDYQENGSLLIVQVFFIQFSFHCIKKRNDIVALCKSRHHKELSWDGIRKQKCANTLYKLVCANNIRTCKLTYRGKPLKEKIAKMMDLYNKGKVSFAESNHIPATIRLDAKK